MTREQLDARNSGIISKWRRTLADGNGWTPPGLLDELAAVSEQHATEAVGEAVTERPAARRTRKAAET